MTHIEGLQYETIHEKDAVYETITYEVDAGKVATVTINRPQQFNSFNTRMAEEFQHLWKRIQADDAVHAVVLRAAEGRSFSSGADVREDKSVTGKSHFTPRIEAVDPGFMLGPRANHCWKPVVTAVHGICCGGAFYWLNESDIIICSPEAEFFDPHVTYGQTCAVEPIGLRYRMPLGDLLRMVLLGADERITAKTALEMRLVSEIVERDRLWSRAHDLASKIAEKPNQAIQGSIRAIWESMDMTRTIALQTAMKYPQITVLTNTTGQVDRFKVMDAAKSFERR
jgi:enoyl-CoA hydratase/carnithine racemase